MLMVKSIPPEEMRGKNEDFIDEKIQLLPLFEIYASSNAGQLLILLIIYYLK